MARGVIVRSHEETLLLPHQVPWTQTAGTSSGGGGTLMYESVSTSQLVTLEAAWPRTMAKDHHKVLKQHMVPEPQATHHEAAPQLFT